LYEPFNRNEVGNDHYISDAPTENYVVGDETIKFTNKIVRTSDVDAKNNTVKRKLLFRFGTTNLDEKIFDVNLHAYLVVTSSNKQNDGSIGWGRNWYELQLNRTFFPILINYWTVSYDIDGNKFQVSPFLKIKESKDNFECNIHIYLSGHKVDGSKVFGYKEYKWDKINSECGEYKLK